MKTISLSKTKSIIVDDEDFESVSRHTWYPLKAKNGRCYAHGRVNGKLVYLHRFIMPRELSDVDHRNRNGLDNRKCNLRGASRSLNNANSVLSRRNKSGFKGVHWETWTAKWRAKIQVLGRSISLGRFSVKRNAVRAYNQAAKIHFGEFARV